MKLALIPPAKLLGYAVTKYHSVLAHLLALPRYKAFYKKKRMQGHYVMLDNSAYEFSEAIPLGALLTYAEVINAQEIVLPDARNNFERTMELTLSALKDERVLNCGRILQAVIQGTNINEHLKCLNIYMQHPEVEVIGITSDLSYLLSGGRFKFLEIVQKSDYHLNKQFHLLGIWENPIEIRTINRHFSWVRSVDTSAPIRYGALGVKYHPSLGMLIKRIPKDTDTYFGADELYFPNIIEHNIKCLRRWCGDER